MSEWISVYQKMPEQHDSDASVTVLLYLAPDMIISGFYSLEDSEWYDFNGDMVDEVSHWMPLPEAPK